MRREASRVSFLMCPFCVRDLLPDETTFSAIRLPYGRRVDTQAGRSAVTIEPLGQAAQTTSAAGNDECLARPGPHLRSWPPRKTCATEERSGTWRTRPAPTPTSTR
jgi:hypothetical protein